jgi:hypothetical protein
VNSQFYLCKGSKTVGPCTLDDLRTFLAYGSVGDGDLVKRAGDANWTPLRQLQELTPDPDLPAESLLPPRRIARYRDYQKVPDVERAGWVLRRLIVGFLLFPPHLWQGALALFQRRIYTRHADENGYLTTWPRKVELLTAALLMINSLAWWLILLWAADHTRPLIRELLMLFRTGLLDLQDWLGR